MPSGLWKNLQQRAIGFAAIICNSMASEDAALAWISPQLAALMGDDLRVECFEDQTWVLAPQAHISHQTSVVPSADEVRFCEEILIDRAKHLAEALRVFRLSYPNAYADDPCFIFRVPYQFEILFQTCVLPLSNHGYNNGVLVEFDGSRAAAVVAIDDNCE